MIRIEQQPTTRDETINRRTTRAPPVGTACATLTVVAALAFAWDVVSRTTPPTAPEVIAGSGFRAERGRHRIVSLRGEPYAIGLHRARLLADLDERMASGHEPAEPRDPDLDGRLSPAERLELLGVCHGNANRLGRRETRAPNCDYVGTVAGQVTPQPGERRAAAGPIFAVGGDRGAGGHAFLAHSLDLPNPVGPGQRPVLAVVEPRAGYAFVSVSPTGLIGVVSGINVHGLAIVVSPSGSPDRRGRGLPPPVIARRILESARNVDEAVTALTEADLSGSWLAAVADRSGRAALLRLSPSARSKSEGGLLGANAGPGVPDAIEPEYRRLSPAVQRQRRLRQVFGAFGPEAKVGPGDLVTLLRDRRAADGRTLPLGHAHALDALHAAHAIVIDPTAGRLWLSTGPHTLGEFLAYDVAGLLAADRPEELERAYVVEASLPADPLRAYAAQLFDARQAWADTRAALERGDLTAAEEHLTRTAPLADHPISLHLRGLLARARGEPRWALDFFAQALRAPAEDPDQATLIRDDMAEP